jgi:hypothetical protein
VGFFSAEEELAEIVNNFPAIFAQIQSDWVKFKLGMQKGLFPPDEAEEIVEWFQEFPEHWETIKPNWSYEASRPLSPDDFKFAARVDKWAEKLKGEHLVKEGLGFAVITTVAIIGGALVVTTLIAAYYVNDYLRERNKHDLIEARVAGHISENEFIQGMEAENPSGIFGDLTGLTAQVGKVGSVALAGGLAYVFRDKIKELLAKV